MKNDYYKVYKKDIISHIKNGDLLEIHKSTNEVLNTIIKYNLTKKQKILELGCSGGKDAYLYLIKVIMYW